MGLLLDTIVSKVGDATSNAIKDGKWFDSLTNNLKSNASKINQQDFQKVVLSSLDIITANKADFISMGEYGLALFLQQVASGDSEAAYKTYIKTHANVRELIDDMNKGSDGLIAAKIKIDNVQSRAMSIAKQIGSSGAQILLPLIVGLI